MALALAEVQSDNKRTRVTLYSFESGDETGFHVHEYDYVIIPLCKGMLQLHDAQGNMQTTHLTQGQCYFRQAGVAHNVVNVGDQPMRFVEVELKP
ncbi:MAG: cupin domain-containing protein [Pseudomonadota bacterium]